MHVLYCRVRGANGRVWSSGRQRKLSTLRVDDAAALDDEVPVLVHSSAHNPPPHQQLAQQEPAQPPTKHPRSRNQGA